MNFGRTLVLVLVFICSKLLHAGEPEAFVLPEWVYTDSNHSPISINESFTLPESIYTDTSVAQITTNKLVVPDIQPRKTKNLGHQFLDIEAPLHSVTADMYDRVDEIIRRVKLKIPPITPSQDFKSQLDHALRTLVTIDETLTELNMAYAPFSQDIWNFSDSLKPRKLTDSLLDEVLEMPVNANRKTHILANRDQDHFLGDCDTISFMYLAVGDALNLPIFCVHSPHHAFIRWYFDDEHYLNWETTSGTSLPDDQYISDYDISQAARDSGVYLSKLSQSEAIGLCHFNLAFTLTINGDYRKARLAYETGMQTNRRSPMFLQGYPVLLVLAHDASKGDIELAIKLATKSAEVLKDVYSFCTLSVAYSRAEDFEKATEFALKALELEPDNSTLRTNLENFRNRDRDAIVQSKYE